jgi:hypothetical protein
MQVVWLLARGSQAKTNGPVEQLNNSNKNTRLQKGQNGLI